MARSIFESSIIAAFIRTVSTSLVYTGDLRYVLRVRLLFGGYRSSQTAMLALALVEPLVAMTFIAPGVQSMPWRCRSRCHSPSNNCLDTSLGQTGLGMKSFQAKRARSRGRLPTTLPRGFKHLEDSEAQTRRRSSERVECTICR